MRTFKEKFKIMLNCRWIKLRRLVLLYQTQNRLQRHDQITNLISKIFLRCFRIVFKLEDFSIKFVVIKQYYIALSRLFLSNFLDDNETTSSRRQWQEDTDATLRSSRVVLRERMDVSLAYTSSRSRRVSRAHLHRIGVSLPSNRARLQLHRVLTVLALSRHRRCVSRLAEGVAIRATVEPRTHKKIQIYYL